MKLNTVIEELQDLYNHLLVKGGKPNHIESLESALNILEEILDDAKETPNTVVWKDNGIPSRKVVIWPFTFNEPGIEPTSWKAYDSDGNEVHWIMRESVGYSVVRVHRRLAVHCNFMTLEQAKAFCEKSER